MKNQKPQTVKVPYLVLEDICEQIKNGYRPEVLGCVLVTLEQLNNKEVHAIAKIVTD